MPSNSEEASGDGKVAAKAIVEACQQKLRVPRRKPGAQSGYSPEKQGAQGQRKSKRRQKKQTKRLERQRTSTSTDGETPSLDGWTFKRRQRRQIWRAEMASERQRQQRKLSLPRRLIVLMEGATREDWAWLLDFASLRQMTFIYDVANKSVRHPHPDTTSLDDFGLTWPAIWVVVRFHSKHRFPSRSLGLQNLLSSIRDFENKIKWQWVLRESTRLAQCVRVPKGVTPPCLQLVAPELRGWMASLRAHLLRGQQS